MESKTLTIAARVAADIVALEAVPHERIELPDGSFWGSRRRYLQQQATLAAGGQTWVLRGYRFPDGSVLRWEEAGPVAYSDAWRAAQIAEKEALPIWVELVFHVRRPDPDDAQVAYARGYITRQERPGYLHLTVQEADSCAPVRAGQVFDGWTELPARLDAVRDRTRLYSLVFRAEQTWRVRAVLAHPDWQQPTAVSINWVGDDLGVAP